MTETYVNKITRNCSKVPLKFYQIRLNLGQSKKITMYPKWASYIRDGYPVSGHWEYETMLLYVQRHLTPYRHQTYCLGRNKKLEHLALHLS